MPDSGSVAQPGTGRWWRVAGLLVTPLALSAVGLTHPRDLTAATAGYWTDRHSALVPLFPLASVLTSGVLFRQCGPRVWPGATLLILSAVSYLDTHIYAPYGVLSLLAMGSARDSVMSYSLAAPRLSGKPPAAAGGH